MDASLQDELRGLLQARAQNQTPDPDLEFLRQKMLAQKASSMEHAPDPAEQPPAAADMAPEPNREPAVEPSPESSREPATLPTTTLKRKTPADVAADEATLKANAPAGTQPSVTHTELETANRKGIENVPMSPGNVKLTGQNVRSIIKEYMDSKRAQTAGVQDQMDYIRQLQNRPPVSDSSRVAWNNLVAQGAAPKEFYHADPRMSNDEYNFKVAAAKNAATGQLNKDSLSEIAILKALSGGKDEGDVKTVINDTAKVGQAAPRLPNSTTSPWAADAKDFSAQNKPLFEAIHNADVIRTLLPQNTATALGSIKIAITRMSADPRPKMIELKQTGTDPSILNRMEDIFNKNASGKPLSNKDKQDISTYVEAVDKINRSKVKELAGGRAQDAAALHPGAVPPPKDYDKVLLRREGLDQPPMAPGYTAPGAKKPAFQKRDSSKMTPEQKAAYIQELKAHIGK